MDKTQQEDLFDLFHDGGIARLQRRDINTIELQIEILYLAEAINPTYTYFTVLLKKCNSIFLETWGIEGAGGRYEDMKSINKAIEDMNIIEALNEVDYIRVNCVKRDNVIRGGNLYFSCEEIDVFDEGGKEIHIQQLEYLADYVAQDTPMGNSMQEGQ